MPAKQQKKAAKAQPRFIRLDEAGKPVSPRAKTHAMVHDTKTDLIWCAAAIRCTDWKDAMNTAKASRIGGKKDWRAPDIQELFSIVDHTKRDPAIDTKYFNDTPDSRWHWSSSPVVGWPEYAWLVLFDGGRVYYDGSRGSSGFVRPVRAARARQ